MASAAVSVGCLAVVRLCRPGSMEKVAGKLGRPRSRCNCEICLMHPHLKEALHRMQPPELRLYSHAELLQLLERDVSSAEDSMNKSLVSEVRRRLHSSCKRSDCARIYMEAHSRTADLVHRNW